MFTLSVVDDMAKARLSLATFGSLCGFFDKPEPDYDDDGVLQTLMSFTLLDVKLEMPWPGSAPDECHGLRIGILDLNDQVIGHYDVAPTFVEAPEVTNGTVSIRISGDVGPYPQAGADVIWERWCDSLPSSIGEWSSLSSDLRKAWLHVVALHRFQSGGGLDKEGPFALDGSCVTDEASFYCAAGEAVNGPGGYFGWNLDALGDCLVGNWGALPGSSFFWDHSVVARKSLPADFFQLVVETFAHSGTRLILR